MSSETDEQFECKKCHELYELGEGLEPTEYCNTCAQELVETLTTENQFLRTQLESKDKLIKDFCHTENEIEKSALKVLTELQVQGDSLGVPGTNQIVDTLVYEVQSLREKLHLQETTQDPQPTLEDFHRSQQDVIELSTQLAEKEADAAVLRYIIEKAIDQVFSEQTSFTSENRTAWVWQEAEKALNSTTAGKACLARMEEAVRLLSRAHPGMHTCETGQWFTDRDALLEQLKGGVE